MDRDKINLIFEYGLNETQYRVLCLLQEEQGLIWWTNGYHQKQLKKISGQPGQTLRKLVDWGILEGPARGELIGVKAFRLTDKARDLLARVGRGLHTPEWMSEHKLAALETAVDQPCGISLATKKGLGIKLVTLHSLEKAGYLVRQNGVWLATELGREAMNEWRLQNG